MWVLCTVIGIKPNQKVVCYSIPFMLPFVSVYLACISQLLLAGFVADEIDDYFSPWVACIVPDSSMNGNLQRWVSWLSTVSILSCLMMWVYGVFSHKDMLSGCGETKITDNGL